MRGGHSADRAGGAADIAVDMMDNASALPTCPQRQQQEKTAFRRWPKITHTTSRRGCFWIKDRSLTDTDALPAPDIIAAEIADDLEAALEQLHEDRGPARADDKPGRITSR
jgi:hypothetical protein